MITLSLNISQLIVVEVTQKKVEQRPITPVNVSLWKFVLHGQGRDLFKTISSI